MWDSEKLLSLHTVKPVYNDHPWDLKNLLLYRGGLKKGLKKIRIKWDSRWSLLIQDGRWLEVKVKTGLTVEVKKVRNKNYFFNTDVQNDFAILEKLAEHQLDLRPQRKWQKLVTTQQTYNSVTQFRSKVKDSRPLGLGFEPPASEQANGRVDFEASLG